MANAWFALPPSLRPSASHRQGVDPIQHGSDQLLMRTPALGGDRTRRLPEPGEIGLACLEQFFREAAHLFKEGNRQAQSPIQEVAPHPLDQATQNLLNCRGLLCLSHLKKQAPPAIEVPGESQEWWAREGQVARGIHGYYPSAGDLSSRSPTPPCILIPARVRSRDRGRAVKPGARQRYHGQVYSATAANVTVPCGSAHWL